MNSNRGNQNQLLTLYNIKDWDESNQGFVSLVFLYLENKKI